MNPKNTMDAVRISSGQVLEAKLSGATVVEMSQIYENLTGRVPVQHIEDDWFLYADGFYLLSKEWLFRKMSTC